MVHRKAQMFVVTAVFMSSMLFVLQQALVAYTMLDSTEPFRTKEVYIIRNIVDSVNDTIKAGGNLREDCLQFQDNVEELLIDVKEDISSEGYVMVTNFELDCDNWPNFSTQPAPFRLSILFSETYEATGVIEFWHRP
jgi:hypothetical protein